MFKGTYVHKIDPKGRLPVPAPFRRALGERGASAVVVTLLDQCLAVYAPAEWQRLEGQLLSLPAFNKQVRALTRWLASRAADCELDVQGRILVPAPLRQAVGLERDAVVVGVLDRFEVWAPSAWDSFMRESERLLEDASFDVQWPPAVPTPTVGVVPAPATGPQDTPETVPAEPRPQRKPKR